ncbi:hypothetical protein [Pantoea allii]|uniref:hypothetical protein n=1 Tax=Pantoea allii TaxID=574096 RepID=UPI001F4EDCDB|nr:hypothetical protein [Pantoea allii]MCH9297399.1 hypothetical protein [Pantoea allii]
MLLPVAINPVIYQAVYAQSHNKCYGEYQPGACSAAKIKPCKNGQEGAKGGERAAAFVVAPRRASLFALLRAGYRTEPGWNK